MRLRAAIAAFSLQALLPAAAQQQPPDAASDPVILKSVSRAVQLEVLVSDAAGRPVHRLQKNDFAVTDNGHPRDIRIFAGETGPGDHANQLGMPASRGAMALVIDAVPRPDGLQKNAGMFASIGPEFRFHFARTQATQAIHRMEPGQLIAIYAACPDLRLPQDYTSDPGRLIASLNAFVPPRLSDAGQKQARTIDSLVPPMLAHCARLPLEFRDSQVAGVSSGSRRPMAWSCSRP